jgi:hypothetical protein
MPDFLDDRIAVAKLLPGSEHEALSGGHPLIRSVGSGFGVGVLEERAAISAIGAIGSIFCPTDLALHVLVPCWPWGGYAPNWEIPTSLSLLPLALDIQPVAHISIIQIIKIADHAGPIH